MIIANQGNQWLHSQQQGVCLPETFSGQNHHIGGSTGENIFEFSPHPQVYRHDPSSESTIMAQTPVSEPGAFLRNNNSVVPHSPDLEELAGEEYSFRLPTWGIGVMIMGYTCVFILGVIGNCSVLIVVARLHRMKTVTNFFICNLALADLLVLLFCLLPNLISNIFIPWILGWFLCKTVPYIQGVSVCASVYSLVAISVERCISIQWPFQYQISKRKGKQIMIAIWIWACSVALPWALFFDTYKADEDHPQLDFCIEKWPDSYAQWSRYYFLIGNFIICYVAPLNIIAICYITIYYKLHHRMVPTDSNHKSMERIHQKAKTAVLKMLLVVIMTFAICWLPLYLLVLLERFEIVQDDGVTIILFPITQFLACLNSGLNPIIYSFLNKKFRHGFYMIFKCSWNQDPHLPPRRAHHKSPTVNILLRRMALYKIRTSTCHDDSDDV